MPHLMRGQDVLVHRRPRRQPLCALDRGRRRGDGDVRGGDVAHGVGMDGGAEGLGVLELCWGSGHSQLSGVW